MSRQFTVAPQSFCYLLPQVPPRNILGSGISGLVYTIMVSIRTKFSDYRNNTTYLWDFIFQFVSFYYIVSALDLANSYENRSFLQLHFEKKWRNYPRFYLIHPNIQLLVQSRCMTVNGQTSYHCSVYKILINLFVWAMIRYCTSTKWVYVSNNGINHFSFKIQWCGLPCRGRAPQPQLQLLMGLASNMGLVLRTPWSLIQVTGYFLKIAEYFCMVIAWSFSTDFDGVTGMLSISLKRYTANTIRINEEMAVFWPLKSVSYFIVLLFQRPKTMRFDKENRNVQV